MQKTDRAVVAHSSWVFFLWYERHVGGVYGMKFPCITIVDRPNGSHNVLLDDSPTGLKELVGESIRSRGFIRGEHLYYVLDLLLRDRGV